MLNEFRENLFSLIEKDYSDTSGENPKILAAVSGGVDSMSMVSLLYDCYKNGFTIATVNFNLRGEESDADEALVCKWARERGIKFFSRSFDTEAYAKREKISVEMAARDLRYSWFFDLMDKEGYDYLAIAHNLNDSVETLFLNILRGTGIDGLGGIRIKNGKIIRPLLKFTRQEILEYAATEDVPFRVDKTNLESHYSRNRIRNIVFPELEAINPSFLRTIERDIEYFTAAGEILREQFAEKRERLMEYNDGRIKARISICALKCENHSKYWLFMLLSEFGFNSSQTDQIYESLEGQPGKEFHSTAYLLIKDRDYLLIYSKDDYRRSNEDPFLNRIMIQTPDITGFQVVFREFDIRFKLYPRETLFTPVPSKTTFFVDADKIKFPLVCRLWQEGDRFIPLGMNGYKKLSDFFIDEKLDLKNKESQTVLVSQGEIICIIGHRIDDRYKITAQTSNILEVKIS
ncbi:MAG: tRNA lysidine(34) synthetase TilS [Bacteroidales bacterium]